MKKFEVTVTSIGEMAQGLLSQNLMVLFAKGHMVMELEDLSVVHDGGELHEDIKAGDKLHIDNQTYTITAVGDRVNDNLRKLGHTCIKFDGKSTPEMPGDIHIKSTELPKINLGQTITIESQ